MVLNPTKIHSLTEPTYPDALRRGMLVATEILRKSCDLLPVSRIDFLRKAHATILTLSLHIKTPIS